MWGTRPNQLWSWGKSLSISGTQFFPPEKSLASSHSLKFDGKLKVFIDSVKIAIASIHDLHTARLPGKIWDAQHKCIPYKTQDTLKTDSLFI